MSERSFPQWALDMVDTLVVSAAMAVVMDTADTDPAAVSY